MIGETISHYRINRQLGAGGMGTVYLAHDPRLERDVAIKVLSEDFSLDESHRQRFLTEARSASALNHPNIVTVYEIGSDQGRDFIAMEHIEGQSLKHLIAHGEPVPPAKLLDVGIQLASALAAAHAAGVIHRDLKPGNVILTPAGRAKILDFGLAKRQAGPRGAGAGPDDGTLAATQTLDLTEPGMILGTPGYMAPEKARGEEGDHRADLFSLGCLLYALATGKTPFKGDSVIDVLHNVIHQEPAPLETARPDLPPALRDVVNRCLAKQPRDRYADAGDLEAALREIKQELTLGSLTPVSGIAVAPPKRRRPWFYALGALALVAAAVAGYFLRPGDGVATTTVSVENEEGQLIERQIPTREFRRRVVVYPFAFDLADTNRLWLTHAVPGLLVQDLLQDYFVSIDLLAEQTFAQEARRSGFPGGANAPLTLKRKAAKDAGCTHFVTGRIGAVGDSLQVEVQLYATDSGRQQYRLQRAGTDLHGLIDTASREVRRALGVPEQHLEDWPDLPVADISTASLAALEATGRASQAFYATSDMAAMRPHLEAAVAADPTYAWALWSLYAAYILGQDADPVRVQEVLDTLMAHLYRLPERLQFAAKSMYFQSAGDPEKQFLVLKMWAELYPDDNMALETLVQIHAVRGEREEAAAVLQRLLELEPENAAYLTQAADFRQAAGDLEGARGYLERLVDMAPDDHRSLRALGDLEQVLGHHERARAHYEKALVLEPGDLGLRLALSGAEWRLGRFDAGREVLETALAGPLNPDERLAAQDALSNYYQATGRFERALAVLEEALAEGQGKAQQLSLTFFVVNIADVHANRGSREEALAIIDDMRARLSHPLDAYVPLFALDIHLDLGDAAPARAAADEVEATIEAQKWEHIRPQWLRGKGRLLELEGDLEGALSHFDRWRTLNPTESNVAYYRSRVLRKLERHEEAQEAIAQALRQQPNRARYLHEAALIAHAGGDEDAALGHLERALEIWKEADPDFAPAAEARATLAEWRQSG